jgi:hypothetical protein
MEQVTNSPGGSSQGSNSGSPSGSGSGSSNEDLNARAMTGCTKSTNMPKDVKRQITKVLSAHIS